MSEDRNDLAYWFKKLLASGVPVPRTEIVRTEVDLTQLLDGITPTGYEAFMLELRDAADRAGYPCFLRTGHTSGKHDWKRTCYVEHPEDLASHIAALVEQSVLADIMGLPTGTWAIREFLRLRIRFTAFGGTPIAREFRTFFCDGKLQCVHPYWFNFPPRMARVVQSPDFTEHFIASRQGVGGHAPSVDQSDATPSILDLDEPPLGVTVEGDFLAKCYEDLGLPFLESKKREEQLRYLGRIRASYRPVEQRFTILRGRLDPLRDGFSERGVQEVDCLALNLLDLDHPVEPGASPPVPARSGAGVMDRETPVGVEDARAVSNDGWLVFHEYKFTKYADYYQDNSSVFCLFLEDGPIRSPSRSDWYEQLTELNALDPPSEGIIRDLVAKVAREFDGAWSLDFASGKDGIFYAIDMAEMDRSFHWPGCLHGGEVKPHV